MSGESGGVHEVAEAVAGAVEDIGFGAEVVGNVLAERGARPSELRVRLAEGRSASALKETAVAIEGVECVLVEKGSGRGEGRKLFCLPNKFVPDGESGTAWACFFSIRFNRIDWY